MSKDEENPLVSTIISFHERERRTRLIEQYFGEMLKGYIDSGSDFDDLYLDSIAMDARKAADAVIKATEEKE